MKILLWYFTWLLLDIFFGGLLVVGPLLGVAGVFYFSLKWLRSLIRFRQVPPVLSELICIPIVLILYLGFSGARGMARIALSDAFLREAAISMTQDLQFTNRRMGLVWVRRLRRSGQCVWYTTGGLFLSEEGFVLVPGSKQDKNPCNVNLDPRYHIYGDYWEYAWDG